ncbi:MAG: hypothetical protein CUN56_06610 [Phototrophicales bacterium]|nr:MAG: hypothetical protein CUN56_06610 [Phototrophicales bacterium]RMG76335.1 MAG: hypothetical protein D6711_04210 [Chloroflexota bacterium]
MRKTVTLVSPDEALGERLRQDLTDAGYTIQPGSMLVVVLEPDNQVVMDAIIDALDNHQHILPILTQPLELPRLIDNLQPLDFSESYSKQALLERVAALTDPKAPPPLTTLTPRKRHQNMQVAYWLIGLCIVIFGVAIWGVMAGIFIPPEDEFAGVDTQVYLTRNWYIDQALPKSTEDALNFLPTVEEARETVQPYLIATATGIVIYSESTWYPRSTQDATAFPATLHRVSTLVQDRMAATVTQLAVTAAAITATPTPTSTP